ANRRCLSEGPFKRLFVQPASGDAGSCLGAAAVAHVRRTGARPRQKLMHSAYLGPSNPVDETWRLLAASGVEFSDYRENPSGLVETVVDKLIQGQVIAWVCGRMEFGPRALGARSILA